MISSHTLKTFVRMHEYKFRAKINRLQADRLQSQLDDESLDGAGMSEIAAADEWRIRHGRVTFGHMPRSRYFRFIPTANHR